MTRSVDIAMLRWLLTIPGFSLADSERTLMEFARRASQIVCPVGDFAAALDRAGFRGRSFQHGADTAWQFPLPENPGGVNRLPAGPTISGMRDARRGQV